MTLHYQEMQSCICDACLFMYVSKNFKALLGFWELHCDSVGEASSAMASALSCAWIHHLFVDYYFIAVWYIPSRILTDRLAHEIGLVPRKHGEWSHCFGDEKSTVVWMWAEHHTIKTNGSSWGLFCSEMCLLRVFCDFVLGWFFFFSVFQILSVRLSFRSIFFFTHFCKCCPLSQCCATD